MGSVKLLSKSLYKSTDTYTKVIVVYRESLINQIPVILWVNSGDVYAKTNEPLDHMDRFSNKPPQTLSYGIFKRAALNFGSV